MILYFSATGNTEFIAKELAKCLADECVNLLNRFKSKIILFCIPKSPLSSAPRSMSAKCPVS